jgi:predicted lipoprotein with Yx(FWY)xxD motif
MRHPENCGGDRTTDVDDDPGRATRAARRLGLLGALTILPLAFFVSPAAAVIAPIVQNGTPAAVAGGIELKGKIYTYESDTTYHFEYGTTTAYGTSIPVPDADAGTQAIVSVAQTVTGLLPGTTYHYRIVANNAGGPGMSPDATFNTSEATPPPPGGGEGAGSEGTGGGGTGGGGGTATTKGGEVKLKVVRMQGKRVLATSRGHTLYSLSAEKKGKFICTKSSGCLTLWKPLMIPKGGSAVGPVKLGSIKRPEGGTQATYRGLPLYTFVEDTKPGEANGEGFKDVGTWHAVKVPKPKS